MRLIYINIIVTLAACQTYAQPADPRLCRSITRRLEAADESGIRNLLDFTTRNVGCLAALAEPVDTGFGDLIKRIEGLRFDKQAGAGSGSAGGTDLVAKGIAAKTLSLAAEYGALTHSTNGQVITFRGNLAGLPSALIKKDLFPYCDPRLPKSDYCVDQSVLGWLRRISFAVSFDASRNNQIITAQPAAVPPASSTPPPAAVPATFNSKGREVSMVGTRVEIWNKRDVSSKKYADAWAKKIAESEASPIARQLTTRYEAIGERLDGSAAFRNWKQTAPANISASTNRSATVVHEIEKLLTDLYAEKDAEGNPIVTQAELGELALLLRKFGFTQDEVIEIAGSTPVLTFEYTNNRPLAQSPTSTFRGILDLPSWKKFSVTLNGAFTIFDCPPESSAIAKTSLLRDAQIGAQIERPLGDVAVIGTAALSAAYYFQKQNVAASLNIDDPSNPLPGIRFINFPSGAKAVFAEKGDIHVGQIRLTLGSGSTVRYPISLSYSSRTELINKPNWRAQVGISYDFDSLFAKK